MISLARLLVGSEPLPPSRAHHKDSPQIERGSRHQRGKQRKSTRQEQQQGSVVLQCQGVCLDSTQSGV